MNALHFFLLRDGFESLTCRLNPCLSSLLVAFIFMCFSSLKNHFSSSSIASRQILNKFTFIEPLFLLVSTKVSAISIHRDFWTLSRQLFNRFSIHRETLCLADTSLTASRSVETLLHALFFTCFASFFYLVIHNILFHYIHAFIWIPCAPLIIFMFLG